MIDIDLRFQKLISDLRTDPDMEVPLLFDGQVLYYLTEHTRLCYICAADARMAGIDILPAVLKKDSYPLVCNGCGHKIYSTLMS